MNKIDLQSTDTGLSPNKSERENDEIMLTFVTPYNFYGQSQVNNVQTMSLGNSYKSRVVVKVHVAIKSSLLFLESFILHPPPTSYSGIFYHEQSS